ncbi:hypothetical protein MNBD_GAMMA08-2448 [hydrothermal vent metagenome]|uniref:Outer membrane protein beta-barrel domain-containing protein n=1 Tax=hydrothermal vent metagenome TaxID=652676 RepID=A0A3B0WXB5_9ZZZZ
MCSVQHIQHCSVSFYRSDSLIAYNIAIFINGYFNMIILIRRESLRFISFITLLIISTASDAGVYVGLNVAQIPVKTDVASTKPLVADVRLGYALDAHKVEVGFMSSINDDNLNELVTDITSATSILYRYTANPKSSFKVDLILGYSQIDIETSYIQVDDFTETYEGVSFGIGFEESLRSLPQLKFKFDAMQLYRGDDLNINYFALGMRYEF